MNFFFLNHHHLPFSKFPRFWFLKSTITSNSKIWCSDFQTSLRVPDLLTPNYYKTPGNARPIFPPSPRGSNFVHILCTLKTRNDCEETMRVPGRGANGGDGLRFPFTTGMRIERKLSYRPRYLGGRGVGGLEVTTNSNSRSLASASVPVPKLTSDFY